MEWNTGWNLSDDPCNIPSSYPTITCDETNPVDKRIITLYVFLIFSCNTQIF